jgi:hypothetical protein
MRLYIAVLDQVPDFMVPTLVAHTMLGAHLSMCGNQVYQNWLSNSFKKCVVRVNQKEFDRICQLPGTYLGHENTTLSGQKSCAIPVPGPNEELPNVLKFAKLWKPSAADQSTEEPKTLIGYCEREEGWYPMYAPRPGAIVTQAFILCKYCNGAVYHCMGPRSDAVCLSCYQLEPELRGKS